MNLLSLEHSMVNPGRFLLLLGYPAGVAAPIAVQTRGDGASNWFGSWQSGMGPDDNNIIPVHAGTGFGTDRAMDQLSSKYQHNKGLSMHRPNSGADASEHGSALW